MKTKINYAIKQIILNLILFVLCGALYCTIELIFRGYSHISMFILAGFLGLTCIDTPNKIWGFEMDYMLQVLIATILCTIAEGITGLIVNVKMGLSIWDYSGLPGTFFWGQCNLLFVLIWSLLISCIAIFFCDAFWYYVGGEGEQPYYKIFNREFLRFPKR